MDYKKFLAYIAFSAHAHQERTLPSAKALRTLASGEQVPYFTHTVWCAIMLLLEPKLPEKIRVPGAEALLLHDVLEDTSAHLPEDTTDEVKYLVSEMTYQGGFDEEKTAVLEKSPLVQLLKLYEKTATLYDGDLSKKRYSEWTDFMEKLITTVEKEYGMLNITFLAKDLIRKYRDFV